MLLSPGKDGLDSLSKEVIVFKVLVSEITWGPPTVSFLKLYRPSLRKTGLTSRGPRRDLATNEPCALSGSAPHPDKTPKENMTGKT